MNAKFRLITIVLVVASLVLLSGCILTSFPKNNVATATPTSELPVIPITPTFEEVTVVEPTNTLEPEPTIEPTVTLALASCTTPSIKAGLLTADTEMGEYIDSYLGERMTYTSRRLIVPAKAWNEVLTADELLAVETTWQDVQVCIPEGTTGRIFASGFEQGLDRYENGVLMTLTPGLYEFKLRNGEIVLWYPESNDFAVKDLTRIVEQIKVGNFDIKSPLAFFGVTTDLLPSIPDTLVKERNVQIVPFPDTVQ